MEASSKDRLQALTLVLGASANPLRYSYLAIKRLIALGYPVVAIGSRPARINGLVIQTGKPLLNAVDTVCLYLNANAQRAYYTYLLELKPRRIIFNPGTENPELYRLAQQANIKVINGCTLVMLASGTY